MITEKITLGWATTGRVSSIDRTWIECPTGLARPVEDCNDFEDLKSKGFLSCAVNIKIVKKCGEIVSIYDKKVRVFNGSFFKAR